MSDLLMPLAAGVVAALVVLLAQQVWERRRDRPARWHRRSALGDIWHIGQTRVVHPMVQRLRGFMVTPTYRPANRPPIAAAPQHEASPERTEPATALADGGAGSSVQPPTAGDVSDTGPRAAGEPGGARGAPARRAKRRTLKTIAADPLDAPLDQRRARVAAGALVHELEEWKIERPR